MRKEQFKWAADAPVVHIFGEDVPREAEPGKKSAAPKPLTKTAARPRTPVLPELPKAVQAPGSATTTAATPKRLPETVTHEEKPALKTPRVIQKSEPVWEKPVLKHDGKTAIAPTPLPLFTVPGEVKPAVKKTPLKAQPQRSTGAVQAPGSVATAAATPKPVQQTTTTKPLQRGIVKPTLAPELGAQKEVGRTKAPSDEGEKGRSFREPRVPILAPELKGENPAVSTPKRTMTPNIPAKAILAPEQEEKTPEQRIVDWFAAWEKNDDTFWKNYINRYTNRQWDHTDGYVGDAQDYLDYVKNTSQNAIKELEAIRDLMIRSNYPLEDVAGINQRLEWEKKKYTIICQTAEGDAAYWSQFENEEDYKAQQDAARAYSEMLNKDLKQLALGIDWVESRTEKVIELIDKYLLINVKPYYKGKEGQLDALMQQIIENSAGWATVSHEAIITGQVEKDMEAAVRQARNYYYEAEKAQTLKKYDDTVNNEDFAQYSKAKGAPASMDEHEGWYIDEDYETYYDTENPHADRFRDMTDTEKAIYNYYLNKEGTDAAESYYEAIQDRLNRRSAEIDFQQMKGHTLLELEQAKWAGLGNFTRSIGGLFNAITGNEERKTPTPRQYLNAMIYEDLADVGGMVSGRSLGQWGFDALEESAEGIPSFVVGEMGGPVADILITGATAGGDKYTEMINKGYSKEEARTYAVLKGSLEAGIAWLINNISKTEEKLTNNDITELEDNVDNIVLKTSIQMADKLALEGNEAGLQELLTPWLKWCATGVEQDKANWTDIAYAALLGGLTAFAEAKDISKEARVEFALKEMERIYKGDITAKSQNTPVGRNPGMTGWDGRVAVTEATGKNIKMDGVTYKFLGYDKDGSPVYQVLEE